MLGRSLPLATALALALPACDLQQRPAADAAPAADAGANTEAAEARCELVELRTPGAAAATNALAAPVVDAVLSGPNGLRLVAHDAWIDPLAPPDTDAGTGTGTGTGVGTGVGEPAEHPLPPRRGSAPWVLGFTGERYVGFAGREVFALDPGLAAPPRSIERLRGTPCDLSLLETGDGVAAVYRESPTERCDAGAGTLLFKRYLRSGAPAGPPTRLARADDREPARRVRGARLDAGRIVVSLEAPGAGERYLVLSTDGQELLPGDGRNVACPRAGCVRLLGREDPSSQAEPPRDNRGVLRVELLGRARGFTVPLEVDRVYAVAALGERVALFYDGPRGADEEARPRVSVVDVVHRRVESFVDPASRREGLWLDWAHPQPPRLAATEEGFVVFAQQGDARPLAQLLRCQ